MKTSVRKFVEILQKSDPVERILWFSVVALLITSIATFVIEREFDTSNLLIQLAMLATILATARQTLRETSLATRATTKSIAKSAKEQTVKLEKTIKVLEQVSRSLQIVAEDVTDKREQIPDLYVSFGKKSETEIDATAGRECSISFHYGNCGGYSASNPVWTILFPEEIEIIDSAKLKIVKQTEKNRHPGYSLIQLNQDHISSRVAMYQTLKIKVKEGEVGRKR